MCKISLELKKSIVSNSCTNFILNGKYRVFNFLGDEKMLNEKLKIYRSNFLGENFNGC